MTSEAPVNGVVVLAVAAVMAYRVVLHRSPTREA